MEVLDYTTVLERYSWHAACNNTENNWEETMKQLLLATLIFSSASIFAAEKSDCKDILDGNRVLTAKGNTDAKTDLGNKEGGPTLGK